jgi:hypothetical protein
MRRFIRTGMGAFLILGALASVGTAYGLASSAGSSHIGGQAEPVKPYANVAPKLEKIRSNSSSSMTALLDGDSVTTDDGLTDSSGNPISLEQYAAEQLGYTVTVVSGTQWDSMTAAQFAQYQLLIVGDPFCSYTDSAATSNATSWAPVVMGTAGFGTQVGNRTLIGTDPEFHFLEGEGGATEQTPGVPTSAGAEHMVQDGLDFAGSVLGATGVYFDTSCGDNGSDLATLDQLTTVPGGTFFDNGAGTTGGSVPCGGSVQQIATDSAFDSGPTVMTDSDIQGWECSDHITFTTYPADFVPLAVATDTPTTPTCGTDPDTGTEACGQAYILLAGTVTPPPPPNITLTPASGSQTAGPTQTHTVTATVTEGTPPAPVTGADVSFTVGSGPNAGATGTCTNSGGSDPTCATDSSGEVEFTYTDGGGAGEDFIDGAVTLSGTTETAGATWTWTSGVTPLEITNPNDLRDSPVQGKKYSLTFTATGGVAPYTWAVATGYTLPAGLTLSTAGVLSGVPTTSGYFRFAVTATDSESPAQTKTKRFVGYTEK